MWKLFLDDIRPPDSGFVLAKSVDEAVNLINKKGFPSFISFDHDLGDNVPSGKDFLNIIVDNVLDKKWIIPVDFQFEVHSDNSVGSENIRILLNNFLRNQNIEFFLKKSSSYSSRKNI